MSEEVINRVDELIRKNNIKYKDQQSQKAYELALKEYEKQSKLELTKQYASMVKEGNRKAVEKAREISSMKQKKKRRKPSSQANLIPKQQKRQEISQEARKSKVSEIQIAMFNKTVSARAERILQEQQLEKLNKQLEEQKKRTKLYELNQKCKKMLSKSHEKIFPAKNVSEEKMEILKKMEEKAFGEIKQLDNIINGLVDKANEGKNRKQRPKTAIEIDVQQQPVKSVQQPVNDEEEFQIDYNLQEGSAVQEKEEETKQQSGFNNFLNLNTLIFQKSTEELLRMNYIPI